MIQYGLRIGIVAAAASLSACGLWWFHDDIRDGDLGGTVTVNWTREDLFIYRPDDPLWFRPHFMNEHERIQPRNPTAESTYLWVGYSISVAYVLVSKRNGVETAELISVAS